MLARYIISKVENVKMSFFEGALSLYIIMFIRTFLENFANSGNFYHMSSVVDTFFHYPIGFSLVLLASFIIATLATGEKISKVAKFVIICSFGLTVPPLLDLIINWGAPIPYVFNVGDYPYLIRSFLTFFGGGAIGWGIKIETLAALAGLGFYIYEKTKSKIRSILGAFCLYTIIFIFLSSPALIFGAYNSITNSYQSMTQYDMAHFYYEKEISTSLTADRTFIRDNNYYYPSPQTQKIQNQYSLTLSVIFLILNVLFLSVCFLLYSSKKFFAVLKNLRYLRIIHNSTLLALGIFLGIGVSGNFPIASLFDLLSYLSMFGAFLFAWLFAVWENDEADIKIDETTNQDRPLVREEKVLSPKEWKTLKYIFLLYSLAFAFLAGMYVTIFILLFIFLYHIYSAPPLRLKQFPIVSSALIAANSLILVWMGFFMTAGMENLNSFPVKYSVGIFFIFLLVENAKNIKDIEGDRKDGIRTLPVIFGEKKGKRITALLLFIGSILVPFVFFFSWYTFLASVVFGYIFFRLTIKKDYKEKYLFWTYFGYVIVFFTLINL